MTQGHPQLLEGARRLAAVSLLLFAIALVASLFVLPTLWLHKHYDAFLEDYSNKLQRYQRVAALRPAIEPAIDAVGKRDGRKFYLRAATPNLAAAELQSLATRIVERHSGRVVSSQVRADKEEGQPKGPRKVSIQLQLAASIIPLQLILHSIESHVPYLFIEKATIASKYGRTYRPEPGIQPEYDVQLTIAGYLLPGEGPP